MPASRTTTRSPLAALADMEHATPRSTRRAPRGTGPAPRPGAPAGGPCGQRVDQRPGPPPRTGPATGRVPGSPTGKPAADVEGVEARPAGAQEREQRERPADPVAPRVHRAQLGADVEVDPARPQRAVRPASAAMAPGELGLGHPELGGAAAHGEVRVRLGRHVGVEPEQDVERRGAARRAQRQPGPPRDRRQRLQLLGALHRDPAQRMPAAAARTAARRSAGGLADALERDPRVRHPGRARRGPLAATTRRSRRARAPRGAR